jgi:hypothetical protein
MQGQSPGLVAIHSAIRQIRDRSRECGCVAVRERLIGVERTLLALLLKAEAEVQKREQACL